MVCSSYEPIEVCEWSIDLFVVSLCSVYGICYGLDTISAKNLRREYNTWYNI